MGPPWSKRQNSFLIEGRKDDASSVTVYAEPHASHDVNALKSTAPVDVAIFPAASSYVAGAHTDLVPASCGCRESMEL